MMFDSTDRECAERMVGRVFRPHQLVPHRAERALLHAQMEMLTLGGIAMCRLSYGLPVDIVPGPLERFYLIQIPVQGVAHITSGEHEFVSDVSHASLISPQPDLKMHWLAENDQIIVRIDADRVQRFVDTWCGAPCPLPSFAPRLSLAQHPALLDVLLETLALSNVATDASGEVSASVNTAVAQLQYRMLTLLLGHQANSASAQLAAGGAPLAPRSVRRVEEYLLAHYDECVTPEQLAEFANVSVRSLFLGFQRYRGISPMRLLRELRLQRAREALLRGHAMTRVSDVALRCGFSHLGRFSQVYREAFGESPRDTLSAVCAE